MGIKTYGIIGVLAVGAYGISETDKSLNYIETEAKITKLSTECTVEKRTGKRKSQLVNKETGELAYLDCELAKVIAPAKGYSVSDIKYHHTMEYRYLSPVDNNWHKDKGTRTSYSEGKYKNGQRFQVLAHKTDPNKTRWK